MQLIMDKTAADLKTGETETLAKIGGEVDHQNAIMDVITENREARQNILATFAKRRGPENEAEIDFISKHLIMR